MPFRSRRTHRKSRSGCISCKKRRIKVSRYQLSSGALYFCYQTASYERYHLCLQYPLFQAFCVAGSRRIFFSDLMSNIIRSLICFYRRGWTKLERKADSPQCDEKKPTCTNCTNHGIDCAYATTTSSESQSTAVSDQDHETHPHPQPQPRRYRPYEYATGGVAQTFKLPKTVDKGSTTQSKETQCDLTPASFPATVSLPDLHLFHHYTISTYKTMVEDGDTHQIWQKHLVEWGLQFPSLMHLILSLSALHLASASPASREQYLQQADDHFTFGIRSVTAVLSQLDEGNCQKIYMAAVIICFVYFGRGPRPGEYLIFSQEGPAEWLVLMRGVKLILQSYHAKVFSGVLEPKADAKEYILTPEMRSELHEHTVHTEAVSRLIEHEITDPVKCAMYQSTIHNLLEVMREVYGRRSRGSSGVALMDVLIGWLYRLPQGMVALLGEKEPYALVVLAYWAVMLLYMESAWFMRGWAEHVLLGISTSLDCDLRPWIEWPLRRMRCQSL